MPSDERRARPATKAATAAFMKRFGRLPPEVKAFGRPVSVHAPNWLSTLTWVGHVVVIVGLMIATAVSLTLSQVQANVAGVHPDAWQLIAAGTCFFGLVAFVSRAFTYAGGGAAFDSGSGFLVYDEALVRASAAGYTVIRWDEVEAILPPRASGTYGRTRVVAHDGRAIDLSAKVAGGGGLLGAAYERVHAQLVPAYLARIAAGETVATGGLGVSRDGLTWKRKSLAWDAVTSLVLLSGGATGLQVTTGRLWLVAWCLFDHASVANGSVAVELVRLVAPEHLLLQGPEPRRRR